MSPKDNDTRVAALKDCIRLAKSVVKAGELKVPDAANYWAFRLLAKITTSAASVEVLLREGCILDTKILLRSMLDATTDLMLVMHGPLSTKQLAKLYEAERIEDLYDRYEFEWMRAEKTQKDFIKANPSSTKVFDEHAKLKKRGKDPPEGVDRDKFGMPWEKRWRFLSDGIKLKYLPEFKKMMELAKFGLRTLGNAHAHARPAALQWFAKMRKTNDFRKEELAFVVNPKPKDILYSREWLAFEGCLLILVSCDQVIDQYHLDERLSKRLQAISSHIRALKKTKCKANRKRKKK